MSQITAKHIRKLVESIMGPRYSLRDIGNDAILEIKDKAEVGMLCVLHSEGERLDFRIYYYWDEKTKSYLLKLPFWPDLLLVIPEDLVSDVLKKEKEEFERTKRDMEDGIRFTTRSSF
ncbi:MAG: hypothetical protein WC242_05010 [Candidatus Paceibacterota bacterium]|jgi:hypothetical protein